MPTTRRRVARTARIDARTRMLLTLGSGMHNMPDDDVRALWNRYGDQLIAEAKRSGRNQPFAQTVFGDPEN